MKDSKKQSKIAVKSSEKFGRNILKNLRPRSNKRQEAREAKKFRHWWQHRRRWQKVLLILAILTSLFFMQAYAIAYWYQQKHKNEPLNYGVTFITTYAEYLGLNPQETFLALRDDLGFTHFRLVSYWNKIETSPGVYDFSDLDWLFDRIEEVNGKVSLSVGLRQPRWPECHAPDWMHNKSLDEWYPGLKNIMSAVVNRYKDRPALQSYQLENEYFLGVFGDCKEFATTRERLVEEFNLVKSLDPSHPVILSLANNYFGIPIGEPRPDIYGISIYKRVFDYTITHRYFEYPFPAWYYSWRSGLMEIITGKSSMAHELQAEPWAPTPLVDTSLEEQNKSMDPNRLADRIKYARDTGYKDIYLWGGEWWYWRKVHFNDPSLWETVKSEMTEIGQL